MSPSFALHHALHAAIKRMVNRNVLRRYGKYRNVQWSNDGRLRVLIDVRSGYTKEEWSDALIDCFDGRKDLIEVRFAKDSLDMYSFISEAEVVVSTCLTADLIDAGDCLKWAHLTIAGVEFLEGLVMPPDLVITTSAGVASEGIAEHVIGLMIALDRGIDKAIERQKKWVWRQKGILEHIRGIKGRTIGIVGMGHNGKAVAALAQTLGMRVICLSRTVQSMPSDIEWVYGRTGLSYLLSEADFLVLSVSLNAETRGLIGVKELLELGRNSYLINVSRGEIVDERALAEALHHKIIAGAALDVLSIEPPPRKHPLRDCPNLIITPHVAGNISTYRIQMMKRFFDNLKAFLEKGELKGVYRDV